MSTVMILPDMHCPAMKKGAIDFLNRVADEYQPDRIVHIGDLVDSCAYSYHEKAPKLKDPIRERALAQRQVEKVTDAFPDVDLLLGNHDVLAWRKAVTAGIDPADLVDFHTMYDLPSGWNVHPRYTKLRIDGVQYKHGDSGPGGINAALKQCKAEFANVVMGHLHSQFCINWHANESSRVFGMSVGCLVDDKHLAMAYGKTYASKGLLGCGIVIDGKRPYLEPWLLRSKA